MGDTRIPVWPNPPKIKKKQPKKEDFVFCPAENRPGVLELYRTHFNLHPTIPQNDPAKRYLTAAEIHHQAVEAMYRFCYAEDLSSVWAYMWNRWYSPGQWPHWAHTASPLISRLRSTMMVENLWKHIKRRDLAQFNRPRLDLVNYLIQGGLVPRVKQTLEYVRRVRRVGRPRALAG